MKQNKLDHLENDSTFVHPTFLVNMNHYYAILSVQLLLQEAGINQTDLHIMKFL